MKLTKKIASVLMAMVILILPLTNAAAESYHFKGNQLAADGKADSVGGIILNIAQAYNESTINEWDIDISTSIDVINGDYSSVIKYFAETGIDSALEKAAYKAGNPLFYDLLKASTFSVYAFGDLALALSEVSVVTRECYEAKLSAYYYPDVNFIVTIIRNINKRVRNGEEIPIDTLNTIQEYINGFSNDVSELRKVAKKWEYRRFKKETNKLADSLEQLYQKANVVKIYNEARSTFKSENNYFTPAKLSGSGSLAVFAQSINKLTGNHYTEQDIRNINKYNSVDLYWGTVEAKMGVKDKVYKYYGKSDGEKISSISNIAANARSAAILQINKNRYTGAKYLLCIGGNGTDILVLDPYGNGIPESFSHYCSKIGKPNLLAYVDTIWTYSF